MAMTQQLPLDLSQEDSPSVLNILINNAVDNRVGRLLRLRRMATLYPDLVGKGRHSRAFSTASDRTDGSVTPPPSYHEDDPVLMPSPPRTPRTRPASADCTRMTGQHTPDATWVKWAWANQGYSMLLQAMPDDLPSSQDPLFTRALYLSSLDYLLQGLPSDLSPAEAARLRRSLPSSIVNKQRAPVGRTNFDQDADVEGPPSEPSRLRRSVANLTFYFMVVVSIILPYIQLLFRHAYEFDRRNKFSERVIVGSIVTADSIGRELLNFARRISAMNDGKVGETVNQWSMWCVEGVSGGLCDGVGEGMQTLGLNPSTLRQRARTTR